MFGLIKHNRLVQEDYNRVRQSYCGTCKTIGSLYGQKERLMLNNDIVFLSELLAEINNYEDDFRYIQINTCFNLPKDKETIPVFLQYAASVNVLLGYYKILDNIEDSNNKINIWQTLKAIENMNFKKAKLFLDQHGLQTDLIEKSIKQQFNREVNKRKFDEFQNTFKHYSELTGEITGKVFKCGISLISKSEFSEIFYKIGKAYGEIVYLIDAIIDYRKDTKQNKFNLFRLSANEKNGTINWGEKKEVINYIYSNLSLIQSAIEVLPISAKKKIIFSNRLYECVKSIVAADCGCKGRSSNLRKHLSIKERYNYAVITARGISKRRESLVIRNFSFAVIILFFIAIFLLFPGVIHADERIQVEGHNCCGKCVGGSCTWCCDCCGFKQCCGPSETKCCYECGDSSCLACLSLIPLGLCLGCFGGGGECTKSEPTKIIIIKNEKGCC